MPADIQQDRKSDEISLQQGIDSCGFNGLSFKYKSDVDTGGPRNTRSARTDQGSKYVC